MTRVLPVPAPARINTGPLRVPTARRCCGFSELSLNMRARSVESRTANATNLRCGRFGGAHLDTATGAPGLRPGAFAGAGTRNAGSETGAPSLDVPVGGNVKMRPIWGAPDEP